MKKIGGCLSDPPQCLPKIPKILIDPFFEGRKKSMWYNIDVNKIVTHKN